MKASKNIRELNLHINGLPVYLAASGFADGQEKFSMSLTSYPLLERHKVTTKAKIAFTKCQLAAMAMHILSAIREDSDLGLDAAYAASLYLGELRDAEVAAQEAGIREEVAA
jgi:hypothetical protein